jgi:hypothetical protein
MRSSERDEHGVLINDLLSPLPWVCYVIYPEEGSKFLDSTGTAAPNIKHHDAAVPVLA